MNILIVGSVLKDVYLNLDSRTENLETDKNGVSWLDISFNASEHHFFNRSPSLGGAAVTMEVLGKLGLNASISNYDMSFSDEGLVSNSKTEIYRYILIADGQVSYFSPSNYKNTLFTAPTEHYDYLFIDRSAILTPETVSSIQQFLDSNPSTKLILYYKNPNRAVLNSLVSKASLIFTEINASKSTEFPPDKTIFLSDHKISYQDISEKISYNRIDMSTHLSFYSIIAATVLGCFILGKTIEESLKLARKNVENSKLNDVLSLNQLYDLSEDTTSPENLALVAANLVLKPKGILAADESGGSIHKKFATLNIPDDYDHRRDYRNIFFTTPNLENYVNGVILFDETARQFADNGQNFVDYLTAKRIIPGIKVDQGLEKYSDSNPNQILDVNPEETWTKGLNGLSERLKEYHSMGLRFAKWRAAFDLRLDENGNIITPTDAAINENCRILAEYASLCQSANLVPIVEPELVYDGYYTIEQSALITAKILDCLFQNLSNSKVDLSACILKTNMVLAGKQFETQSTPEEIGVKTAEVLKNHVPDALAGIVFLSGGQTPEQATDNLASIIKNGPFPWPITFSFARALQDPALYAWAGDNVNIEKAHEAFLARLIANTDILR